MKNETQAVDDFLTQGFVIKDGKWDLFFCHNHRVHKISFPLKKIEDHTRE